MPRVLRALALLAGILGAMTAWRVSLLPRAHTDGVPLPPTQVTVAYHVHTTRSDGTGTIEDVAAAAAAAGVQVVVITDHGDGTRATDPPRFIDGVLVIDAAEIGTWGGHYVALDARPSPFPLGGDPATVVADVASEGGTGFVAHPTSAHAGLAWRRWELPFDGLEWLNADSEWRDRPRDLWSSLLTFPWRSVETVTALLDRPVDALAEWDRQAARRPVAGLVAHDAHARIGLRGMGEPYDGAVALRAPSYETMFRAFTNVAMLAVPLPTEAGAAARAVTRALAQGHSYAVITGQRPLRPVAFLARSYEGTGPTPPVTAEDDGWLDRAEAGFELPHELATTFTFHGDVEAPSSATSRIVCNGVEVASALGGRVRWTTVSAPGACRFEVDLGPPFRVPWVVTNPIYVWPERDEPSVRDYELTISDEVRAQPWTTEHGRASSASATLRPNPSPAGLEFRWTLGVEPSPFAAVSRAAPPKLHRSFGVFVAAEADVPQRVWVQLRTPDAGGLRWGKSLRLGEYGGGALLWFDDFVPLDGQAAAIPLDRVTALLLVVDTVHNRRGDSGTVRLKHLAWATQRGAGGITSGR